MHSFERLVREHKRIMDKAAALALTCHEDRPADAPAALAALATELDDHLATEDIDIYPRLIMSSDVGTASAARESIAQFDTLAADYSAYCGRWTPGAIDAGWGDFVVDTDALLTRLTARIKAENELLYPLALRAAHIRLRE